MPSATNRDSRDPLAYIGVTPVDGMVIRVGLTAMLIPATRVLPRIPERRNPY